MRGILVDHATLTDRSFATLLKSAQIANGGGAWRTTELLVATRKVWIAFAMPNATFKVQW